MMNPVDIRELEYKARKAQEVREGLAAEQQLAEIRQQQADEIRREQHRTEAESLEAEADGVMTHIEEQVPKWNADFESYKLQSKALMERLDNLNRQGQRAKSLYQLAAQERLAAGLITKPADIPYHETVAYTNGVGLEVWKRRAQLPEAGTFLARQYAAFREFLLSF